MKNILEYVEQVSEKFPNKPAFVEGNGDSISFADLVNSAKRFGTSLAKIGKARNRPIVLFFDKNVLQVISMLGTMYSGNFYVLMDHKMPHDRINAIFQTLQPEMMICEDKFFEDVQDLKVPKIEKYSAFAEGEVDLPLLLSVREKMVDTDIAYALYTSGSTGLPKGIVINHATLIAYINWYTKEFEIDDKTVFGGQTPFYFSASVSDFYATLVKGATYYIIPKMLFSFPVKLVEFLNENKINTIYWVPSALCILANLKVFDYTKPEFLKKVMFIGEIMPNKQLNYWRKHLPNVAYANLYGPTETVDVCTFYKIDREFRDDEALPIGKHCDNCDVFILKEDGTLANIGEEGELCVRGSFLASGYYNMPEKTAKAFPQNPLNSAYPERIYRTGDIVKELPSGEIVYITRNDFQIKHMGYRIELGEIEIACGAMEAIRSNVCIYDQAEDLIVLLYEGKVEVNDVFAYIKSKVPQYMVPNLILKVKQMPHNANGKIDRAYLKNNYKTYKD